MTREKAVQASNLLSKIETYEALTEEFLAIIQARVDKYTAELEAL